MPPMVRVRQKTKPIGCSPITPWYLPGVSLIVASLLNMKRPVHSARHSDFKVRIMRTVISGQDGWPKADNPESSNQRRCFRARLKANSSVGESRQLIGLFRYFVKSTKVPAASRFAVHPTPAQRLSPLAPPRALRRTSGSPPRPRLDQAVTE